MVAPITKATGPNIGTTFTQLQLIASDFIQAESDAVVHKISGTKTPAITYGSGNAPKANLVFLFSTQSSAAAAWRLLNYSPGQFDIGVGSDAGILTESRFVVSGQVSFSLDPESKKIWIVTAEVTFVAGYGGLLP